MKPPVLLVADLRVAQAYRERGVPRYCQALILALAEHLDCRPGEGPVQIACLIDPATEPPLRHAELARRCTLLAGPAALARLKQPVSHYLQGCIFDAGKPLTELFPPELVRHRPRLGAIVYDLIPWIFAGHYLADPGVARAYRAVLPALANLDRLFVISESVREDVVNITGADPLRVDNIYGGLDEDRFDAWAAQARNAAAARPTHLQNAAGERFAVPERYWLYVGGDDYRKNLPRLFQAFAGLAQRMASPPSLVVACSLSPGAEALYRGQIRGLGLPTGQDIILTGFVPDAVLADLMRHCVGSIFPSLYEGLGLPVLEAYAFGRPVLASDASSLKELVPPSCRFDPTDANAIADAVARFHADPALAQDSARFAPAALDLCRWPAAAAKVAAWLTAPAAPPAPAQEELWLACPLPPEQSGVAYYTQQSLASPAAPVRIFIPATRPAEHDAARQALARQRHARGGTPAPCHVEPLARLATLRHAAPEQPVTYVLGNSTHHLGTLRHLLDHGAAPRDIAHLHDISLLGMLGFHFSPAGGLSPAFIAAMLDAYPAPAVQALLRQGWDNRELLGPRWLLRQAGVRRFAVNSRAAAQLLRHDLGDEDAEITTLFLPVLPVARVRPERPEGDALRVGHFGILGAAKQPELLVAACEHLQAQRPVRLLFAGYDVQNYLNSHGLMRPWIDIAEAPDDARLLALMAGVDLAVQLRHPERGESSGVVNQLLSLARPVLCYRTGAFADLDGAATLLPVGISAAQLADAMARAATAGWQSEAAQRVGALSVAAFEARLRALAA